MVMDKGEDRGRRKTVTERTRIIAMDNGPFLVKGPLLVIDAEGNEFRVEWETAALCRCGGSTNKPFCDGAHSRLGFQAAERAVERDQG